MNLTLGSTLLMLVCLTTHTTLANAENQSDIDMLKNKGDSLIKFGKYDEAITYYDKILEIDPNNVDALINKGVALGNLDKYNEAISYFDKVLEIDPNNVYALNNKGTSLIKLSRYKEAISYFDIVLEINPRDTVALDNKQIAMSREGSYSSKDNIGKFIIYVQIQIRNADGQLAGYIESDKITVEKPDLLDVILDTTTLQKSNFTINGQNFELKEIGTSTVHKGNYTVHSKTGFVRDDTFILLANHDGYQLVPGDTFTALWKIIRPTQ